MDLAVDTSGTAYHPYHPNPQAARMSQSRSGVDLPSSAHGSHHSGVAPREAPAQHTSTSAMPSPRLTHTSEVVGGMRDLHLNGSEPRIFPGVISRPQRRGSLISKDGSRQSSGHETDFEAKRRSAIFAGGIDGGVVEEEASDSN